MGAAQDQQRSESGAFAAFARFVLCGGGVGLASSFAVVALASWIPWVLANALTTVVSTLLATELHARFTFGAGGRATWRQHVQSAGSAAAAYLLTCVAMLVLQQLVAAPGVLLEQAVYLSASALAGVARFVVLRLVVFARGRSRAGDEAQVEVEVEVQVEVRTARPVSVPVGRAVAPVGPAALCRAA
ncbi:GtrA family protein [Streptomyces sp. NPDC050504]|uniref:GtrA family protein n=1 Tax=Streptomyces sp. NPDC050504 TaxID=3365618 RepID=UPI0037B4D726